MRLRWRNRRKSKPPSVSDRLVAYRPGEDMAAESLAQWIAGAFSC